MAISVDLNSFLPLFSHVDIPKSVVIVIYNQCHLNLAITSKIIHGKFTQEPIIPEPLHEGYPTTAVAVDVSKCITARTLNWYVCTYVQLSI